MHDEMTHEHKWNLENLSNCDDENFHAAWIAKWPGLSLYTAKEKEKKKKKRFIYERIVRRRTER